MNPYWDLSFFPFLQLFFYRLFLYATGALSFQDLSIDEVQIFSLFFFSIATGIIGVFLLLRRMLMIATALSHTVLFGVIIAFLSIRFLLVDLSDLYQYPIYLFISALFSAWITALLELFLTKGLGIQKDAGIGLAFNAIFALGILLVTLFTRNMHMGIDLVTGSIDGACLQDLRLLFYVALLNSAFLAALYPALKITSFDPILAKSLGSSLALCQYVLLFLTAITIIASFRATGIVLVLSFLVVPYLCARLCTAHLSKIVFFSPLFGSIASIVGVAFSRHILSVYSVALSTGALVTVFLFIEYGCMLAYQSIRRQMRRQVIT